MASFRSVLILAIVATAINSSSGTYVPSFSSSGFFFPGYFVDSESGGSKSAISSSTTGDSSSSVSIYAKVTKNSGGKVTVTENGAKMAMLLGPVNGIQYKLSSPILSKLSKLIEESGKKLGMFGNLVESIAEKKINVLSQIAGNLDVALSLAGLNLNNLISEAGGILSIGVEAGVISQSKAQEVATEIIKSSMSNVHNKIASLIDLLQFALKQNLLTVQQCINMLKLAIDNNVHKIQGDWSLELFLNKAATDSEIISEYAAQQLKALSASPSQSNNSQSKVISKGNCLLQASVKAGLLSSSQASEISSILLSSKPCSSLNKLIKLLKNGMKLGLLSVDQAMKILVDGIKANIQKDGDSSSLSLQILLENAINSGIISSDISSSLKSQIKSSGCVSSFKTKIFSHGKQLLDTALKSGSLSSEEAIEISTALEASAKSDSLSDLDKIIKLISSGKKLNWISEEQAKKLFVLAVKSGAQNSYSSSNSFSLNLLSNAVSSGIFSNDAAEKFKALMKSSGEVSSLKTKIINKSGSLLGLAIKAGLLSSSSAAEVSSLLLSGNKSNLAYKNTALFIKVLNIALKQNIISQDEAITLLVQAVNAGIYKNERASSWSFDNVLNIALEAGTTSSEDAQKLKSIEASLKQKSKASNSDKSSSDESSSSSSSSSESSASTSSSESSASTSSSE